MQSSAAQRPGSAAAVLTKYLWLGRAEIRFEPAQLRNDHVRACDVTLAVDEYVNRPVAL